MSRFFVRLALAGAWVFFAGLAFAPAAEQETTARPLASAGQAKILAVLDQPTEFSFHERPLGEVIDYFKHKHDLQILFDRKALDDEGVGMDAPVTQTLKNIRLRSALRLILKQLDLTYIASDGFLLITTDTEAENKLSLKVYPVQDLVALEGGFRPAPIASAGTDDSPSRSDMLPRPSFPGIGGFGLASRQGGLDDAGVYFELIELITTTIEPTGWDEVGGPGAISANPHTRSIAVSQTDAVHEQIAALLADLRRVRDRQLAVSQPVEPPPPEVAELNKPYKVRAFRLMRRTQGPGKSGWRPPTPIAGDAAPPQNAQAGAEKQKAPEPAGAQGDPAKQATADQHAESDNKAKETAPAQAQESAAGAAGKKLLALPKDEKLESLAQEIVKLVPQIIEPQSWEPHGEGIIRAIGEGIVVRHTEEVQHRVARLVAELLPDCVPMDFGGPWGPWRAALEAGPKTLRLRPATIDNWPSEAEPRPCGAEARIEVALREKCDFEFARVPLLDALNWLAERRQVQLSIDYEALRDEGFDFETRVTCSAKGLSCKAALELLLDERKLTYVIRHEVLLITTKTEAENILITKVYPVFDLVASPPNGSANRTEFDFNSLIENITTAIEPTSWDEVGGPGAIQSFTNSAALVISQRPGVHDEIAEYLKAHREVAKAQNASR